MNRHECRAPYIKTLPHIGADCVTIPIILQLAKRWQQILPVKRDRVSNFFVAVAASVGWPQLHRKIRVLPKITAGPCRLPRFPPKVRILTLSLRQAGTSRRDVPARAPAGGTNANSCANHCAAERGADGAARRPYQGQCQDAPLDDGNSFSLIGRDVPARAPAGGANANSCANHCAAERGADGAARRPYQG